MAVPHKKSKYWFILGREPMLAAAEIGAVLNLRGYDYRPPILKGESSDVNCDELISSLGGTIKIGVELQSGTDIEDTIGAITAELKNIQGKIHFGISFYGGLSGPTNSLDFVKKLGLQLKKLMKEGGFSVRYVENKEPVLSSVTVEKNNLTRRGAEFLLTEESRGRFALAKTCAVQPFEKFSARDYGRPGRDELSGMLPPKLAMMMINLAQAPKTGLLLDPFCGSGTILTEATLLGYENLIGADVSQKAISDSEKNLAWLKDKFAADSKTTTELRVWDVNELAKKIKHGAVDAIVTEPYLGKPLKGNETKKELLAQAEELKQMYLRAFVQFSKILKTGGTVVVVIPRFRFKQETISINCIEEIKNLGFEPQALFKDNYFLTFSRPDQKIIREIWKFKRK